MIKQVLENLEKNEKEVRSISEGDAYRGTIAVNFRKYAIEDLFIDKFNNEFSGGRKMAPVLTSKGVVLVVDDVKKMLPKIKKFVKDFSSKGMAKEISY